MEVTVLIDCPAERLDLLGTLAAAAGTPLARDGEHPVLRYDFSGAATAAQLVEQAHTVWEEIKSHVKRVSGASRFLANRDDLHVRVERIDFVDEAGDRRSLPLTGRVDAVLGPVTAGSPDDRVGQIGHALTAGTAPATVFRLLDDPLDWSNLYRIYEVITDAVGGDPEITERRWATMAEIRRFTGSANHPAVTGDRSRHGTASGPPPRRTMSLPSAVAFVKRLAENYLRHVGVAGP